MDGSETGDGGAGLAGKRIVLGVTGGIAAYKAAELCRLFVKAGATVRVVMTEAATRFIAPLTLQTLSGAPVALDLFDAASEAEIGHIRLADEADLLVVAPATADFIARMAAGMADDLLAAVVLATRAPILLAPAMNVNMWTNPVTQANLTRLLTRGPAEFGRVTTVGPDRGELACGWIGAGRLIEPADIVAAAAGLLTSAGAAKDLAGRRIVVTAGATREPVDSVRFLGNRSSGKMGAAVAEAAVARGADVTLVAGPDTPAVAGARRIDFETAAELERALADVAARADVVVMAAAVADFRPRAPVAGKLARRSAGQEISLALEAVPDLLAGLARARSGARPYLVGFAAETVAGEALAERGAAKLREKRCDAIVANDVSTRGIGFGSDDNEVTLLFADGERHAVARAPKRAIADRLWSLLVARLPAGGERMPDPRLKTYAPQAVRHLAAAGHLLADRQETIAGRRGNVPTWPGCDDVDFHGTLSAIWIWARHQRLSGANRYQGPRSAAWSFVDTSAKRFIPDAIDNAAGDETAYDCALVLIAAAAEQGLGTLDGKRQGVADRAARVLANHLGALEDLSGREFSDPGFLAFALAEYARAVDERGLLASARKFVDRAFGMKVPTSFAGEPAAAGGLFDFSSTTATRILAVVAAEGPTPFVGAWLRERVAASVPNGFTARRQEENTWNACAAWALGRAYVVSTDPVFMQAYSDTMDELERRDADRDGALARDKTVRAAETAPTFYYALAVDALVTPESASAAQAEAGVRGR